MILGELNGSFGKAIIKKGGNFPISLKWKYIGFKYALVKINNFVGKKYEEE